MPLTRWSGESRIRMEFGLTMPGGMGWPPYTHLGCAAQPLPLVMGQSEQPAGGRRLTFSRTATEFFKDMQAEWA